MGYGVLGVKGLQWGPLAITIIFPTTTTTNLEIEIEIENQRFRGYRAIGESSRYHHQVLDGKLFGFRK
eukprot:8335221-Heterocapsa_arctica.AAC.1